MNQVTSDRAEISLRLHLNGRYSWVITTNTSYLDGEGAIETIKKLDAKLQEEFPNHMTTSSGRVWNLKEDLE